MDKRSYQVYAFGNFKDIEYKTDIVLKLMELFQEYGLLPNSIQEFNPQISMSPISRPLFSTSDNLFSIEIGADRIIIRDENLNTSLDQFIGDATVIIEKVFRTFDKKASRVSFLNEILFPKMEIEKLNSLNLKFINPLDFYKNSHPFEWHTSNISRSTIEVSDRSEVINIATGIGRAQGTMIENHQEVRFDRIHLKVDINTIPENIETRLTADHIRAFLEAATTASNDIIVQVESVVND